jgi:hypothetical protein
MIIDALTNPPMLEWNNLSNEERTALVDAIDGGRCRCCDAATASYAYEEIRKLLKKRERRYFQATMDGPPENHHAHR